MSIQTYYPIAGRIALYEYDSHNKPERITATVITDLKPDEQGRVWLAHWQINGIEHLEAESNGEVTATLTIVSNISDEQTVRTFPCKVTRKALPRPASTFEWDDYGACWRHKKTGARFKNA